MRERVMPVLVIVLLVSVIYLLTLDLWGLRPWGDAIDYERFGTWAEALSGIGTTSAVIVALSALVFERSAARKAEMAKAKEEETAVFVWLAPTQVREKNTNEYIKRIWDVRFDNRTRAPIYMWRVDFGEQVPHKCSATSGPIAPGESIRNVPDLDAVEPSVAPRPSIYFEGRDGRLWKRAANGALSEVSGADLRCEHTI